ncbi:calcium/sodium antiporter [Spiribacter vilamensis]|uniref:Cation:H+ antiporter n=1 Tax=Spiribacter vilamensis TaxID=531306 RepID=A0A4Q8CY41_9GAMM|nr:calcium/sodium antiporter [Spiribacter vilamensis]RZU97886.1 cation:H+ antiporter [Spiribacter vilamensis]TVO61197.1 calcium/sodium antiporter [Spiribacter vilamensis]
MLLAFLIVTITIGFVALAWSADRFVDGSSALARHLGVSSLMIGLTVVGIGTSLPEMLVSTIAALEGTPGIALGNALGSNIANVGLILGTTALVSPLIINAGILRREFPLLMIVVVATGVLLFDGALSRVDGLLLLAGMIGVLAWMAWQSRHGESADALISREIETAIPEAMPLRRAILWTAAGLVILIVSSRILVWAAVALASQLGISDLVIGLTIVAVGTSLPELAAGIASVRRGESELAVGNIMGSNVFNLLAVLGIAGAIAPFSFDMNDLARDYGIMTGFMLAIAVMGFLVGQRGRLSRWKGGLLIIAYCSYQGLLFFSQS